MKITHKTTRETLERATKAELAAALNPESPAAAFREANSFTKTVLVETAAARVATLAEEAAKAEAEAKAAHDAALAAEAANPKVAEIKAAAIEGLKRKVAECEAKTTDFTERLAKYGVAYAIRWAGDEAYIAEYKAKKLHAAIGFFERETAEPTKTLAELVETLDLNRSHEMDRALDGNTRTDLESIANHAADCYAARVGEALVRELNEARADLAAYEPGRLGRLWIRG